MVDNETLEKRLKPQLKLLNLSEDEQQQLIKELNYISDLLIDGYVRRKQYGKHKADTG